MSEKTDSLTEFRFRYLGSDFGAAGTLRVESHVLRQGKKLFYKIIDEPPDLEEEVKSNYTKKIVSYSETEFTGSVALRIYHIAFNSKVVLLTRRREIDNLKIYDFLKGQCSQHELNAKLEFLKEYPAYWTNSTEDNENNPISIIESVIKRVETVEELEKRGKRDFPIAVSGLCLFVLFTCIETLSVSFIPYNNWLQSRKTRAEVDDAINIYKELSPQDFLENTYNYYLQRYGMNRAIKNFFNELDPSLKNAFIASIKVYYNEPSAKQPKIIQNLDEAIDYLIKFRNSFSHGFVDKYGAPTYSEAEQMKDVNYSGTYYITRQDVYNDGSFRSYATVNLLGTMKRIINHSLWNWIKSR